MELVLASRRSEVQILKGNALSGTGVHIQTLIQSLPFQLTEAQNKVFTEIKKDLSSFRPMQRLVQGDVGSGKTIVSFLSVIHCYEAGFQSALMVPTEILAEQHFQNAQRYLAPLGLRISFLSGKSKDSERQILFEKLKKGEVDFLIGTHALIEDEVQFLKLALVIIDEQHRFGVDQRSKLRAKGMNPHMLIMTATPIPRTLAMTVYGDLDVSIIDQLPEGRTPIQTRVVNDTKRMAAFDFMNEHIRLGRQAYVVYPLVEESEKIDLKNAVEEFENLKKRYPEVSMGLLHGKMKSQEKELVMKDFRDGKYKVLVSTTVIEVGVDVPNANIMIIEHAERFGLSQLHQLRGRVGRGVHKSFCILMMSYAVSEEGRQRLEFMEKSQDGFKISEFDLEMRGPGEFMGTRQSGLPGFKMAHLVRDLSILKTAREAAFELVALDPKLEKKENEFLRQLKELKL
jgi:ATP-dependent DNA helicase RecG